MDSFPTSVEDLRGRSEQELSVLIPELDEQLGTFLRGDDGELRSLDRDERDQFDRLLNIREAARARIQQYRVVRGALENHPAAAEALGGVRALPATSGWTDKEGRPIRVLRYGERMSVLDGPGERSSDPPLSWRKYLRGILTGNWRGAEQERSMVEGTQSAGGYLVPTPLSDQVIDRARNAVVTMRAGAQVVPMEAATLSMARVTGDIATPAWHTEALALTPSDMTFDRVLFTARTLAALATVSVELAEDAANADDVVSGAIAKVLAIELDRAALRGSGTPPEPQGIRFQTGVGVDTTMFGANGQAISSTLPTLGPAWDWLSKTIYTVRGLNEYPNAALFSERTGGELDLLRASTGAPLPPPISVAGTDDATDFTPGAAFSDQGLGGRGVQLLSTNSIINTVTQGTGTTCSSCYVGDFTKLLIGLRRELVLELSRTAGLTSTTSAFGNMLVGIRAYLRADIQLLRPAAFRVVEGIL